MNEQTITEAHGACRRIYTALTELLELTNELSEAIQRQDQVSVQLFLSMRQEPLEQLRVYDARLRRVLQGVHPGGRNIRLMEQPPHARFSRPDRRLRKLLEASRFMSGTFSPTILLHMFM